MTSYIVRRLIGLIPTIFVITVIVFLLMHAMPGNAFTSLLVNPRIKDAAKLYKHLVTANGLNLPLYTQYWDWISNVVQGNLGNSTSLNESVAQAIGQALPNTLLLAVTAEIIILVISIPIGVYQANKVNTSFDVTTSFIMSFLYSIPGFVFALALLLVFSFTWRIFPANGTITPGVPWSGDLGDHLQHLFLPAVALSLPALAYYSRLTRGNSLAVIVADFVRTARSKGLRGRKVLFRHVLRNAIIPIVTQFGFDLGGLFGGAVIIEEIFTWPGMGELTLTAVTNHDYPVIMGTTLIFAITVLLGNLVADILLALADPRIRYD